MDKVFVILLLAISQLTANPVEMESGLKLDDERIVNGRDAMLGKGS